MTNFFITAVIASLITIGFNSYFHSSPESRYVGAIEFNLDQFSQKTSQQYAEFLGAESEDIDKTTDYLLYRYGRMEKLEKSLLLAPDVPPPACDDSIRGLLWFVRSEDQTDLLLVCLKNSQGAVGWTPLPS